VELSELEPRSLGLASSKRFHWRRVPQQRDSVLAPGRPVARTLEYVRTRVVSMLTGCVCSCMGRPYLCHGFRISFLLLSLSLLPGKQCSWTSYLNQFEAYNDNVSSTLRTAADLLQFEARARVGPEYDLVVSSTMFGIYYRTAI
jgi:hypothetical protein